MADGSIVDDLKGESASTAIMIRILHSRSLGFLLLNPLQALREILGCRN
jgi:hypothetical protein